MLVSIVMNAREQIVRGEGGGRGTDGVADKLDNGDTRNFELT